MPMLPSMNSPSAGSQSPRPIRPRPAVATMPMPANTASSRFLRPVASASAPRIGDMSAMAMKAMVVAMPKRNVAVASSRPSAATLA